MCWLSWKFKKTRYTFSSNVASFETPFIVSTNHLQPFLLVSDLQRLIRSQLSIFSLSLSLQTCSHHPGRLMPHNNYPWPAKIVSPEVLILHNVCRRVVSPVMIMYSCEGSDCDHKAPHSQPMRGRGECHQSVSRRWEIIALSLTEIDTNEDKKQSLHLGH